MRRQVLILVAMGMLAYGLSLSNKFVWDDEQFIVRNRFIREFEYVDEIFRTNTIAGAGEVSNYYRPLTTLSFLGTYKLFGLSEFWFHATNTLLHVGAGVVLYLFLKELKMGEKASFWISLVFLVHPIQTEAVVYANSRGDSLYTLFLFLGLWVFARSFRDKRWWLTWVAVLFYGLSVLSKEIGLAGLSLYILVF